MWAMIAAYIAQAYGQYQQGGGHGGFISSGDVSMSSVKSDSGHNLIMPILDGSNWTVSTGKSSATGATTKSGTAAGDGPAMMVALIGGGLVLLLVLGRHR